MAILHTEKPEIQRIPIRMNTRVKQDCKIQNQYVKINLIPTS